MQPPPRSNLLHLLPPFIALAVILYFGLSLTAYKLHIVKQVQFIGHADEAAYANMAKSLVQNHNLNVNYISWFFLKYPDTITHREDHWPPFMALAIAPFFSLLGIQPWVAKIPAILIGSLALPLLTAALAMVYSRRAYVGLIAGLLILTSHVMFTESLRTLCDVPTAALVAGFCFALLAAPARPRLHLLVGLFIALAYYCKGSEIILFALYPLASLLLSGPRILRQKHLYLGLLTALLLISPYLYSNYKISKNPFLSTQNYVAGYIGLSDADITRAWEIGTYKIYWDPPLLSPLSDPPHPQASATLLPKPADRWTKFPPTRYHNLLLLNREAFTRWAILGPGTGELPDAWDDLGSLGWHIRNFLNPIAFLPNTTAPNPKQTPRPILPIQPLANWHEPLFALPGLAALLGVPLLILLTPIFWYAKKRRAKKTHQQTLQDTEKNFPRYAAFSPTIAAPTVSSSPTLLRPTLALLLILFAHWLFLVLFWQYIWMNRLAFLFSPIMLTIGITMITRLLESPFFAAHALYQKMSSPKFSKSSSPPTPAASGGGGQATLANSKTPTQPFSARLPQFLPLLIILPLAALALILGPTYESTRLAAFAADPSTKYFPWVDQPNDKKFTPSIQMGQYLHDHLPTAIVMTRYPQQMLFYAADTNKALNVPLDADLARTLAVARYYHCTHIVHDFYRPVLEPLFHNDPSSPPGFKQIPDSPNGNLYELDWSKLSNAGILPATAP